ncbi:MAG: enoyl-CoA hydratase/isomerase family protein [Acetobacteraceae bacterium]
MPDSFEFIDVSLKGMVAEVEVRRPPNNHVSVPMIAELSSALERLDADPGCRVVVLCAAGKHFCAGADLAGRGPDGRDPTESGGRHLYKEAIRLWSTRKPIVAAVQGAAVGAGLGLAVAADFRVSCAEARFSANFTRLGFHPGFGLTATLPRLIGVQHAAFMMYTARRFTGEEAKAMGLVDQLVPQDQLREAAHRLAREIAESAPLAVVSFRETLRRGLADAVQAATEREYQEQTWLRRTEDYKEGVRAMADRRTPEFKGS